MTAKIRDDCLVCGGESLRPLISIPDVPALCNRLCTSGAEAVNAPRGDICLNYCLDCGHVSNAAFDQVRVNYDGTYENTLAFSPRYQQYADSTANRIINRYGLSDKNIVEIGSGNGDFLRLLCGVGNHGAGYDPSQPTSRSAVGRGDVNIIGRNFVAENARGADFVCCRHVLEHLADPVDLLRQLHDSIALNPGAAVFFEVPNALFILDHLSIWDLIYEHVSYFTPSSLARAFDRAGFTVCDSESAFGHQFLWLEARVDGQRPQDVPKRPPDALYGSFGARFAEKLASWRQRLNELQVHRRKVVIWGAGSKGTMFLNLLRVSAGAGVDYVVDINPRKHGHLVPLTGQKIAGPQCLLENPPEVVVVMNPEYEPEIRSMINDFGIGCEVVCA